MKDILASFIFLTRLPFWRICEVPAESFKHVVAYWPLVGWLTGGVTAGVLWLASLALPMEVAWIIAVLARLLVTGCLHEDGLADFFDGFGGGTTRERTLEIMKDSRIGTYGVIGLALYFLLLYQMHRLPVETLCALCFCGDVFAKFVSSHIINVLPYARKEQESKAKVVYSRMTPREFLICFIFGVLPVSVLAWRHPTVLFACIAPVAVFVFLCAMMKRRIGGYTGDCVGALFLISELMFLLVGLALWSRNVLL